MFPDLDSKARADVVLAERVVISAYDAQQVELTEFWSVMRAPPISINHAYSTGRSGTRFLTTEGRKFKAKLTSLAALEAAEHSVSWNHVVDSVYKNGGKIDLTVWLYFADLRNKSWRVGGGQTRSGETRSPYQKKDGSNYLKLIEDAISSGTGIDDSANLDVSIKKREDPLDPRIVVRYRVIE